MRKDMSKVIVERPRLGRSDRRKGRTEALRDDDDAPLRQRAATKKPAKTKSLNENLAPLRRFLEKNTGRPWDKVYAEIAENIRPTSTVQQHVLEHLRDFVAIDTRMKDGVVVVSQRFGRTDIPVKESWTLLYVHPKTGILMRNRQNRQPPENSPFSKKPKAVDRRRDLGPFRQAHLFRDGAWWDVVLEADPHRFETVRIDGRPTRRKVYLPPEDAVHAKGLSDTPPEKLYGRPNIHAASVRRLTKAQRKELDLP
jgi:hypothetical protein